MKRYYKLIVLILTVAIGIVSFTACDLFKKKTDSPVVEATFNISYELNGGENNESNPYSLSETSPTVKLLPATRMGYEFLGWYRDAEFQSAPIGEIVTGNVTDIFLYARWQPLSYKITLNYNDGSIDEISYTIEDEITLPTKTRNEFVFVGWYSSPDFSGKAVTVVSKGMGDKSYYAKWSPKTYKIKFHTLSGEAISDMEYTISTPTFSLPKAERSGSIFIGWYDNVDYNGLQYTEVEIGSNEDFDFYARFEDIYYANFQLYSGEFVSEFSDSLISAEPNKIQFTKLDSISLIEAEREGFVFGGWYVAYKDANLAIQYEISSATNERTVKFTEENKVSLLSAENIPSLVDKGTKTINLYVKWELPSSKVHFETVGGNSVFDKQGYVNSKYEFPVPVKTGYKFLGWYMDAKYQQLYVSATETEAVYPTSDVTVFAKWQICKNYITFDALGGNTLAPIEVSYNQPYSEITIPVPTYRGYTFSGWYSYHLNGSYDNEFVYLPEDTVSLDIATEGITLYAKWEITEFKITYHFSETAQAAINSPNNLDSYTFLTNSETQTITLFDPSWEDGNFVGWYLNDQYEGAAVRSIYIGGEVVLSDVNLYAKFNRRFSVSFKAVGSYTFTMSEVEGSVAYYYENGADINLENKKYLPVSKKENFQFEGWYSKSNFSGSPVTIIKASELSDVVLYAKFVRCYTLKYKLNGADYTQSDLPISYIENQTLYIPKANAIEGKNFYGWYENSNLTDGALAYSAEKSAYLLSTSSPTNKILYALYYDSTVGLIYRLNDSGTYSVCGYTGNEIKVKIPPYFDRVAVTEIAYDASETNPFSGNSSITRIEILGNELKRIQANAFSDMSSLGVLIIPDGLTEIGDSAVSNTSLTLLTIPSKLEVIATNCFKNNAILNNVSFASGSKLKKLSDGCFSGCSSLSSISLPDSIIEIGDNAFKDSTNLTTVLGLSNSLTFIGSQAFMNTNLTSISLPDSIYQLGKNVFYSSTKATPYHTALIEGKDVVCIGKCLYYVKNKALSTFVVDEGIMGIAGGVFTGMATLTSVTLPETLCSIGDSAFMETGLREVTLKANVVRIDKNAFRYCAALDKLTILSETPPTIQLNNLATISKNAREFPAEIIVKNKPLYVAHADWSRYVSEGIVKELQE